MLDRRFLVYSNQEILKHLLQQQKTPLNQQEWMEKLLGFEFEVVYNRGVRGL